MLIGERGSLADNVESCCSRGASRSKVKEGLLQTYWYMAHPKSAALIEARVASWHQTLVSWASSGKLAAAASAAFGSELDQNRLQSMVAAISGGSLKGLPRVEVLSPRRLQGHWTAYAAETNTIYADPDLGSTPTLATYALSHELGHWMAQQLLGREPQHSAVSRFTNALVPVHPEFGVDSDEASHGGGHDEGDLTGQIVLPNGKTVNVSWFDTGIHNNWDNEILPFLSANARVLLEAGQNDTDALTGPYSNQFVSDSHFDNSNITGGLSAVAKRYQDGLSTFNSTSVDEATGGSRLLLNPSFSGVYAGVEKLVYRFGAIVHALQDFYAHSNWVELARKGRLKSSALLEDSLGLPRALKAGEFLPSTNVMVATAGADWPKMLKKSGTGSYSGTKYDVYWNVNSTDPAKGGGEVWATTLDGREIYGLATGATNGALYHDPDQSVFLRDPTKTGITQKEYFRGFDHGGIAGTVYGQWVGPLNKDSASNPNHLNAKKFVTLQVQQEWDRLGNLIYQQYGVGGLQRFADFALADPSDREVYVRTFSTPGARFFPKAAGLRLQGPAVQDLKSNLAGSAQDGSTLTEDSGGADDGQASSLESQGFRFVRVFNKDSSAGGDGNQPDYINQIQFFDSLTNVWRDSNHDELSIHHELDADELVLLRTPRAVQHVDNGQRASWTLQSDSFLKGKPTNHYVETANQDVVVGIPEFDFLHDRIVLVNPATGQETGFDESYYSEERLGELLNILQSQYNVVVNVRPFNDLSLSHYVLSEQRLGEADGTVAGVSLSADQFFDDYDSLDSASLRFTDYDSSLPFLELVDGKLVFKSNVDDYRGVSASVKVTVSDGVSEATNQYISIAVAPKITLAGFGSFDPGTQFVIDFDKSSKKAYQIYAKLDDGSEATPHQFKLIGSQIGSARGVPQSYDVNSQIVDLVDPWSSGRVNFYLSKTASRNSKPLDVRNQDGRFGLYSGQTRIAVLQEVTSPTASSGPEFEYAFDPFAPYRWLGLALADGDAFGVAGAGGDGQSPFRVRLQGEIHRESKLGGELGLYLVDRVTGEVIDPSSGDAVSASTVSAPWESYAVWTGSVQNKGTSDVVVDFNLAPSIALDQVLLVPYAKVSSSGPKRPDRYYFAANSLNPEGQARMLPLASNVVGIEMNRGLGNADFDDYILHVNSLEVI